MGILGTTKLVTRSRDVSLGVDEATGEELKVVVKAPPLQLANELRQRIPAPTAPPLLNDNGQPRYETDSRTGEPIKKGGQLVPKLNWTDPNFLVELKSVERARTIAMIFECTKFPGPSSVKPNGQTPVAFELARWKELEKAGCTIGVYNDLSNACLDLSDSMTKEEVEDARRSLGTDKATSDKAKEKLGKKAPEGK